MNAFMTSVSGNVPGAVRGARVDVVDRTQMMGNNGFVGNMPNHVFNGGNGAGNFSGHMENGKELMGSLGNHIGQNHHHFGGGLLEGAVAILLLALFIAAVVYIIKYLFGGMHHCCKGHKEEKTVSMIPATPATPLAPMSKPDSRAFEILKERYAKGEINKDEFENIRRDIA